MLLRRKSTMTSVGGPPPSSALGVAVPCQLAAAAGSLTVGAFKPRLLGMPDAVLERIDAALTPVDRLRARQTCRRFCDIFGGCHDVVALEIRYEQNACCAMANSVSSTSNPSACHQSAPQQQPHHYLTARAAITSTLQLPSRIVGGARKRSSFSAASAALTQPNGDAANVTATGSMMALKYRVRLVDVRGVTHRMRTLNAHDATRCVRALLLRQVALRELTIWDACLTSAELIAPLQHCAPMLTTLRLWNCRRYFLRKICGRDNKLLETLLGSATNLRNLLVLESGSKCCGASSSSLSTLSSISSASSGAAAINGKSTQGGESGVATPTEMCVAAPNPLCQPTSEQRAAVFGRQLAVQLRAPIENLQLTGVYLPLRSMEAMAEQLGGTCQRLAIGCTFGKEAKRPQFLRALANMKSVSDLDFPPFIFHLRDSAVIDPGVQRLIHHQLPLKSMGFRHYNSTVLFRFIETQLPHKIRFIRVYHNANRVPNFAELGQSAPDDQPLSAECYGGCDCCTATGCGSGGVVPGSMPITPSSSASSSSGGGHHHQHHHQLASGICAFLREKKLSITAKYNMLSTSRSSIASSTTTDNGYATTQSSTSAAASTTAVTCTACRSGKVCSDHGSGKLSCPRSGRTSSTSTATTTTTVTHNDEEDEYDSNNNIFKASSSNNNSSNLNLSIENVNNNNNDSRHKRSSTYGGNQKSKAEYDNTIEQPEVTTSDGICKSSNTEHFDGGLSKNRNSYGSRQPKFDGVVEDGSVIKLVPKSKSMSLASGQHYYGIGYGMDDDVEPLRLSASSSSSSASSSQSGFGMLSERHSHYQLRESLSTPRGDTHSDRRSTNSGRAAIYSSRSGVVLRKRSLPQAQYSDSCSVGGFNYYGGVTRGSSIANCCHSVKSSSGSLASTTSKCYKSGNNYSSAEGTVNSCCIMPEDGARRHHYSVSARLAAHRLTIFAVAEERSKRRAQRLRKRTYCGVDVIYMQETLDSQEIFGRMALPMQFPHVYSKSFPTKTGCTGMVMTGASSSTPSGYGSTGSRRDNRLRIIKGDLVKPIPLSSLGMESDYELSDWEA